MSASEFETVQPLEVAESTPVGVGARIDWDRADHSIEFVSADGSIASYSEPEIRSSPERPNDPLLLWTPEELPVCLLGSQSGLQLVRLDTRDGALLGRIDVRHHPDPGLRVIRLLTDRQRLLVVTEIGLTYADGRGNTIWQRSDLQPDWHLVSVDPTGIHYESESRGRWRFALLDGSGGPPPQRAG